MTAQRGRRARREARGHRRPPWISIGVLIAFGLVAVFAPLIAPHDPTATSLVNRLEGPRPGRWLGSDDLGRDILSRLIYGDRVTFEITISSLVIGAGVGVILGVLCGYFGGWFDSLVSRIVDVSLAFPPIFFGLVLAATRGPGIDTVVIAISFALWAQFARIARGEVLSIRQRPYVAQAIIHGRSSVQIMVEHILPNIVSTVMVLISINAGLVVILDAILSFLGAGVPAPTASWGGMTSDGQGYITSAWWISLVPGIAIVLVVLALNGFGDWLRDRLDPTLRTASIFGGIVGKVSISRAPEPEPVNAGTSDALASPQRVSS